LTLDEGGGNSIWRIIRQPDGSLSAFALSMPPGRWDDRASGSSIDPAGGTRSVPAAALATRDSRLLPADDGALPASELLGFLRLREDQAGGRSSWLLVAATDRVGVNGMTPPLPVVLLQPGMLLSLGDEFWIVTNRWAPEPIAAPPELADKECPVCGFELKVAPVVACLCGNVMHLERPESPDDSEALNCYLTAGSCGSCLRPTSLAPRAFPEIPEPLLPALIEDDEPWASDDAAAGVGS
jgi:hypothetical protein